jgi:phospholipase/carboxylesterase
LHGLGSDERDLFTLADRLDPNLHVASLRAPLRYGGGFSWFSLEVGPSGITYDADEAFVGLRRIADSIVDLQAQLGVEPRKTVVAGFSQGAMMSIGLLKTSPQLFGISWLMSGAVLPELTPDDHPYTSKLKVLIQHGINDQVVPVEKGRETHKILTPLGFIEDRYHEYYMGHEISSESLSDAVDWLDASL